MGRSTLYRGKLPSLRLPPVASKDVQIQTRNVGIFRVTQPSTVWVTSEWPLGSLQNSLLRWWGRVHNSWLCLSHNLTVCCGPQNTTSQITQMITDASSQPESIQTMAMCLSKKQSSEWGRLQNCEYKVVTKMNIYMEWGGKNPCQTSDFKMLKNTFSAQNPGKWPTLLIS